MPRPEPWHSVPATTHLDKEVGLFRSAPKAQPNPSYSYNTPLFFSHMQLSRPIIPCDSRLFESLSPCHLLQNKYPPPSPSKRIPTASSKMNPRRCLLQNESPPPSPPHRPGLSPPSGQRCLLHTTPVLSIVEPLSSQGPSSTSLSVPHQCRVLLVP